MFSLLRGGGGYEPLNGSDNESVESFRTVNGDPDDNTSINSMDLNGDGVVTEAEAREYVKLKLSDKFKGVVNAMPNSVGGHIANVVLGGALVAGGHYGSAFIGDDTASKMNIGGIAMVGTGMTGLMSSGFKFVFGKPLQPQPEPRPDITRIV